MIIQQKVKLSCRTPIRVRAILVGGRIVWRLLVRVHMLGLRLIERLVLIPLLLRVNSRVYINWQLLL